MGRGKAAYRGRSRGPVKAKPEKSRSNKRYRFVGHKEDELAKAVSEVLAAALDTRVVVTAGIHWDNLSQEGIQKVMKNSEILADIILEAVSDLS